MTDETADDRMKRLITGQFNKKLPRKFYKQASVSPDNAILLDGRAVKTPMKHALILPNRKLAEAVAAEWQSQTEVIDPATMPLTKQANTALDRATAERRHVLKEIVDYAGSDLVCYWADRPPELVALQRQQWQPILNWFRDVAGAEFHAVMGVTHQPQPQHALDVIAERAAALDPWRLTALYLLTTLTGSTLLSFMLVENAISAEAAWTAAHADEDYQISQWGEDDEAMHRRAARRVDFNGLVQFLSLLE